MISFRKGFTTLCWLFVAGTAPAQTVYSLDECVQKALQRNLQLQADQYDLQKTQANVQQAKSYFLPQVKFSGSYQYYLDVPTQLVPAAFFGGAPNEYRPAQFSVPQSTTATLQATQTLYDGQLLIALKASKAATRLNTLQIRATREDLVYNVSATYYNIQTLQKQHELRQSNLANTERLLQTTTNLFRNGLATQTDVNRLTVSRDNAKAQLQSLQNDLDKSHNLLKYLMNMPLSEMIAVQAFEVPERYPEALGEQAANVENRTDWLQLKEQQHIAELEKQRIRAGFQPNLSLASSYGYNGFYYNFSPLKTLNNEWYKNSYVQLQLNIPIFDGFNKRSQLKAKNLELNRYQTQLQQTQQRIEKDVADAVSDYNNNLITLQSQQQNMQLAEKVYGDLQLQYKNGLVKLSDVLTAENDMKESQNSFISALIKARQGALNLRKARGELIAAE